MLETLKNINLGKVSDNDLKESKSITVIRDILEQNNKIKVRTQEADKIPNLDGRLMILDEESKERITVEVQSKSLPSEYDETSPYKYDCDTKVFNVVLHRVTFNPVVLMLVDIANKKIYWKYISSKYANSLNIGSQETKRITFSDEDLYFEDKFIDVLSKASKDLDKVIKKGENALLTNIDTSNPYYYEMQQEIDRLNNQFDNGLKMVKDFLFPDVWKFGVAYSKDESGSWISVYTVKKGQNGTLIKNFDVDLLHNEFTGWRFVGSKFGDTSVRAGLNDFLSDVLNTFFNIYPLNPKYLADIVLNEIAFHFLDRLSYDIKEISRENNRGVYFQDNESVDTVINYLNGLKRFYYELSKDKNTGKQYPMLKTLTPYFNASGGKFLVFNPFIKPIEEEYELLLDCIKDQTPLTKTIFLSSSDVDFDILELTLLELKKRKIDNVHRVWKAQDWDNFIKEIKTTPTIARGYTREDFYKNLGVFFDRLQECIDFSYKSLLNNDNAYNLKKEFLLIYDKEKPYSYTLFQKEADTFILNVCSTDYESKVKEYSDLKNYTSQTTGSIDRIFALRLPMYTYIRLIMNIAVSNKLGVKFKYDSEANRTYDINTLPIISNLTD